MNHKTLETSGSGRSRALDGLRGFAAVAVVFYHAILHNDLSLIDRVLYQPIQASVSIRDLLTKLVLLLQHGEVAVFVFFVLSGTVLQLSLNRRLNHSTVLTCITFIGVRLLRLYPPLVVCLVFFFVLGIVGIQGYPSFQLTHLIENASLLKISMHGPSTTIQAEVMAIPFILVAWLLRRYLGLPGMMFMFIYSLLAVEKPSLVFHLPNMHAYLMAFMAGMLAAEPILRPLIRQIPTSSWWFVLGVLIFCRAFHPQSSLLALVAMVMSAAFLVSGLLSGQRGSLVKVLEMRMAQALGRVSFSLYLLNVPVLYFIWAFTDSLAWPKTHALEVGIVTGIISLLLTWPLAHFSERWVEQFSIALGRKFATVMQNFHQTFTTPKLIQNQ